MSTYLVRAYSGIAFTEDALTSEAKAIALFKAKRAEGTWSQVVVIYPPPTQVSALWSKPNGNQPAG